MNKNKKQPAFTIIELPTPPRLRRTSLVNRHGFTIVELLVVIVIIAILAIITIVAYNGITTRASNASIQSDLVNASNVLRMYQVDNTKYPDSVTDCPNPSSSSNICLKLSSNNTASYNVNNSSIPQSYNLTITNSTTNTLGAVTSDSKPIIPASSIAPLSPVADWLAMPSNDHYGNYYDSISKQYATVTRSTPKTIYDPLTQHIYDVPANYLGIRPRTDNKSGFEAEVEERRTNYLTNSSFETDSNSDGLSDGWVANGTMLGTIQTTRVPSQLHGQYAQRFQYTGVSGDVSKRIYLMTSYLASGFSAGGTASVSVYIKGSATGVTTKINISDQAWVNQPTTAVTPTSTFTKYTVSFTCPTGTTGVYAIPILIDSVDAGDTVDLTIDAVQLEKGSAPTSYIPTTTAAVTRDADLVTVPTTGWSASTGTVAMVLTAPSGPWTPGGAQTLWYWGASSNDRIWSQQTSGGSFGAFASGTGGSIALSGGIPTGYTTYAMVWNSGNSLRSYRNGGSKTTGSTAVGTPNSLPAMAYIGSSGTNYYGLDSPAQRFTVYSSALSDTDVSTVTNAIKDGP